MIEFGYDIMRRLVSVKDKQADTEPTNRFTYDIAGRLKEVTRGDETITANYDRVGRLISYTSADSKTVGYEFDNLGRRTKLVYPDNSYITYHYDDIGRLLQIRDDSDPQVAIATFAYDQLSRRTSLTLGNGSVTTYDYEDKTGNDNLGDRVEGITVTLNDPCNTVLTFAYTYDDVGNCLTRTINGNKVYDYEYDNTYRLLESYDPMPSFSDESYTYDAVGNWLTQRLDTSRSFTANALNQYSLIDSTRQPTYDNSGNMTNDGNGRTCTFDSENRLMTGSKGSTDWEYDYDPFGRRVLKDIDEGETVTRYVYDGPHCIAEYNGQGTLLRKYVYGPGIDEPLVMKDVDGATVDDYYYHRDALGNVMALSDSGGNIEEGYTYSAFGIAIVNTSPGPDGDWLTPDGTTSDKSARGNPYMFTGRRYDGETGLYYYRARYYDATLGRFISADPISYAGGINLYAYVNNNPITWLDPMGLSCLQDSIFVHVHGGSYGSGVSGVTPMGTPFYYPVMLEQTLNNAQDLIDFLEEIRDNGGTIDYCDIVCHSNEAGGLYFSDHGSSTGIEISSRPNSPAYGVGIYDPYFSGLIQATFATNAEIRLNGCMTAYNENNSNDNNTINTGEAFLDILPDAEVWGYTQRAWQLPFTRMLFAHPTDCGSEYIQVKKD